MNDSEYAPLPCSVFISKWGFKMLRIEHWLINARHNRTGHFLAVKIGPVKFALGWNSKTQNNGLSGKPSADYLAGERSEG